MIDKLLLPWALRYMRRSPDVVIQNATGPYLERWYVLPRSARRTDQNDSSYRTVTGNLIGFYIHRFLQSDEEHAPHDHPRHNASLVLDRGYWEHIKGRRVWRPPGSIVIRRASTPHRIELETSSGLPRYNQEAISLFITGPRIREWGFHCPKGWVMWKDFYAKTPRGGENGCS